jgi:serine phosphatase RsbU (regulator of sigma subunit)
MGADERRVLDFSGVLLQLAGDVGPTTDSLRLYRETLERARTEHEIKVAAEIQRALLPHTHHAGATFDLVATSVPCRAIGGDFFDYFEVSNGIVFALGDIAGKGPPAALLSAMLQGIFAAFVHFGEAPAATVRRMNDVLVRRGIESRFATGMYSMLSCEGQLTYCNAGHNPPFLLTHRGVRRLERGGPVLGLFEHAAFDEETLQLDRGDTLVVFSDGISEALNSDGEESHLSSASRAPRFEHGSGRSANLCTANASTLAPRRRFHSRLSRLRAHPPHRFRQPGTPQRDDSS